MLNKEAIAICVERSKREILADIASGLIPATVSTFSALHDYTDANCYGGFCDAENKNPHVWSKDGQLCCDFVNAVQEEIDQWLASGPAEESH